MLLSVVCILIAAILFYSFVYKLIFFGVKPNYLLYSSEQKYGFNVSINSVSLQGWMVPGKSPFSNKVAVFFGGNAQECAGMIPFFKELNVASTYFFNYRGYGLSGGKPNERMIYSDSLALIAHLKLLHPHSQFVVVGFSMGSAVAGHVLASADVDMGILVCPISSIGDVIHSKFGVSVPNFLLPASFNLLAISARITIKTLIVLTETDEVIANELSIKVCNKLGRNCSSLTLEGVGHNDVFGHPDVIQVFNDFIG